MVYLGFVSCIRHFKTDIVFCKMLFLAQKYYTFYKNSNHHIKNTHISRYSFYKNKKHKVLIVFLFHLLRGSCSCLGRPRGSLSFIRNKACCHMLVHVRCLEFDNDQAMS